ncbi:MAG TPA: Crp/Fnr family transcriptional regulator [Spirochaetia bacterium]|nr:Crp/Fnr family transcriptional regulator [Spirochaetia bacterium]
MTKSKFTQIKKFFSQFPTQKFSKGKIIIKPGDKFENIYFIKNGFVRAYTKTTKGENTINLFRPLFYWSIIHFISKHRNDFIFEAITPVEINVVPYSEFKKIFENDKKLNLSIMELFFSSLMNYFINQGNIVSGCSENKIASVLLQLSQEYGNNKNGKLTVNFPATHRIIANLVGLTRETTSVQMSKFQKKGVISTKRTQFIINDLEKLKKLAGN